MHLPKLILAVIFAFTGSFAWAANSPAAPAPPVPQIWTDIVCQNNSKQVCLIAQGWAWLRTAQPIIDSSVATVALSGGTYVLGVVARLVVGETPTVVYVLTASKVGMQAGAIMFIGGLAVVIIGTFASAASFLLATTTSTAGPQEDEQLGRECPALLAPFQTPDGAEKLLKLSVEEMTQILPCIPKDRNLSKLLGGVGQQIPDLENQIHAN